MSFYFSSARSPSSDRTTNLPTLSPFEFFFPPTNHPPPPILSPCQSRPNRPDDLSPCHLRDPPPYFRSVPFSPTEPPSRVDPDILLLSFTIALRALALLYERPRRSTLYDGVRTAVFLARPFFTSFSSSKGPLPLYAVLSPWSSGSDSGDPAASYCRIHILQP